ncbi:aspartic peptidase domain-containing protein [Suillus spraguei]|nr:aspartic peptidase domain-containing protein [Suillus spraguei]
MFSALSLLALLVLSITGLPVEVPNSRITLPMTRRLKFSNSTNLVQHDEARVAVLRDYSTHGRRYHINLQNSDSIYVVSVGIGNPSTNYHLIVDTSSAVTWVGASTPYMRTSSSFNTGEPIRKGYGPDAFFGTLWTDAVTLLDDFTATRMPIGVLSNPRGFVHDGILGIGPVGATHGTLPNHPRDALPTITECLYTQHVIQPLIGIFFRPTALDGNDDGQLSFGQLDPTMYIDNVGFTLIVIVLFQWYHPHPPSSHYWGFDQRITYGAEPILDQTAGILDSGLTFIAIAPCVYLESASNKDAYDRYRTATGANLDAATGLLTITLAQYNNLLDLNFHIGEEVYSLKPNAQIWPRSINQAVNGIDGAIYLVVKNLGIPDGGCNFLLGYAFLQRFYTVLDGRFSRIGFAKTRFTDAGTN